MTRYTNEEPRSSAAKVLMLALVALAIGFLVGKGTAGSGEGRSPSSTGAPSGSDSDVSVGYSHDRDGAAAAAANLSAALAYSIAKGPERLRDTAERIGTASYSGRLANAYEGGHALDPTTVFRAVPLTYRVLRYSPELAAVRMWSASVLAGDGVDPGVASFKTATIVVRWQGGDWKVDEVRDAVTGPTPFTADPDQGRAFVTALDGMERFHVNP